MPAGEGGLEPGQSPTQAGGSGSASQNAGADYNNEDFLRDLLADGLVDQSDVTGQRGAPKQDQSEKGGGPGAEPQKVDKEPAQEREKTEGREQQQQPTAAKADPARADAQLPGPGPGPEGQPAEEQQLSSEERWRREAQSEKDKRYVAEAEKERLLDQFNARQQTDAEAQLQSQHNQYTAPQRNLVNSLYAQWAAATQEGDADTANLLSQQWNQAKTTLDFMDGQYSQTLEGRKQQKVGREREQHLKVVDRQLKEDFDTSIEDLKKVKSDLNPYDPFSLQKAIAIVQKERVKAAETRAKVEAEKILDVARTKWGYTDPGSQPDRGAANGAGAGRDGSDVDYTGMSVDAILADALAGLDTGPGRKPR